MTSTPTFSYARIYTQISQAPRVLRQTHLAEWIASVLLVWQNVQVGAALCQLKEAYGYLHPPQVSRD